MKPGKIIHKINSIMGESRKPMKMPMKYAALKVMHSEDSVEAILALMDDPMMGPVLEAGYQVGRWEAFKEVLEILEVERHRESDGRKRKLIAELEDLGVEFRDVSLNTDKIRLDERRLLVKNWPAGKGGAHDR